MNYEEWRLIIKDEFGFATDPILDEMYRNLPILVASFEEGMNPTVEYIDKDNWSDSVSDFNKPRYKAWMSCGCLDRFMEGGEK